jgi:hypothetical protein
VRQLVEAGYDPDTVIEAVTANDLSRLKGSHSGETSVQLQPPMGQSGSSSNGSGNASAVPAPQQ